MPRLPSHRALLLLVLAGAALRAFVVVSAENRLDCDEATVGVMALDVLEGRAFPLFFYGNEHNGGAALEAYLGALAFALFGPSETALKLALLALWTAAALLFADLCRRALPGFRCFAAVLFFCVATPFFLEWSVKARGGYAETVLFSVLLLWLAQPPRGLRERPDATALAFGGVAGLGLWASPMLLPLLPCAAIWLLARRPAGTRVRTLAAIAFAAGCGAAPLLAYNLLHGGETLSDVVPALLRRGGMRPLSLDQLRLSARFVFGPAAALLLSGVAIGALRLARATPGAGLGRTCLAHVLLYLSLYTLAGLRHLPIPPSRLIYALYPSLAVLLACALPAALRWRSAGSALAALAVAAWLMLALAPVAGWVASRAPREAGSWRASWCLVDGAGLYGRLAQEDVAVVYVARWTQWPLRFAARAASRRDPAARSLEVSHVLPREGEAPTGRAAFALPRDTRLSQSLEAGLRARGIPHRLHAWGGFALFTELEAARIHRGTGLPWRLQDGAWPPLPQPPDGFN